MKIQLSFVPRPWPWQWIAGAAGALCVALLIGAGVFGLHYREAREERSLVEGRLARVSRQLSEQPAVALPEAAERAQLRDRIATLNAQGAPKGWPTAQLLLWLEQHMPADVRLISIHHKARDGEAVLVAESGNSGSLTVFLQKLERDPAFSEVLLSKQGAPADNDDAVRFEIRLRLKA